MDKYIKESELFKRILNVDFKHDYDGCIKFCQSIPAADVAEVKHGRWADNVWVFTCSECGNDAGERWDYCPHCGAKMDEPRYCDRNICASNEVNGIGCDECEVTMHNEKMDEVEDAGRKMEQLHEI